MDNDHNVRLAINQTHRLPGATDQVATGTACSRVQQNSSGDTASDINILNGANANPNNVPDDVDNTTHNGENHHIHDNVVANSQTNIRNNVDPVHIDIPDHSVTSPEGPSAELIRQVHDFTCAVPKKSIFEFDWDTESAVHNEKVLRQFYWSVDAALEADRSSHTRPGSEFKPVKSLWKLLENHPLWFHMEHLLSTGSNPERQPLVESNRFTALTQALLYKNHKSALSRPHQLLRKMLKDEVKKGWMIPLPLETAEYIPGLHRIFPSTVMLLVIQEL